MKKSLLISLILLSWVLLTACGKDDEETIDTPTEVVITDCQKAVNKYLDWADKEWKWDEVKEWDNIVVDYIWRLADGTVFDTSIESIARACDKYVTGANYTQWLSFQAMWWQMVKWFDEWVVWMKIWQTKTVQFWPEKWYWKYEKDAIVTVPLSEVGDMSQFSEGDTVYFDMWYSAKIVKITDKDVTFDFNHELAGKDLIFDITLKSIN
jgi:FKBP-type peptidyl-prolyl cis-trans isomerase 2